ncbi:5' exonuclease Apollo-like [Pecten maximus]|uniref:5' exonuclease Apollo-like n=1 Tax=Pecten maximus TaxID=6579 RepID=UPI0014583B01|nr:5' exonuclease Apollo-like [Pecten maximus]XP_033744952.1 5' exonuclease Apollo-like [Pecten maximus]
MNGTVIRGTPIAVDFWKIRECPSTKLFFLTHLHGDHIVGLSSSWKHAIHCSPMTGELLTELYGIEESLIQPLEVGTSHIIDLDDVNHEKMSVTVIDANHCPGSVMFLFEGYFGRILHTGDFRFSHEMINQSNESLFIDIDLLYLDNTYCSPQCVFPTRDSALGDIVSIINSHPDHSVVIGMRNLGKEDMLAKTALKCKEWISIPATMMRRVSLLKLPNVFVVDDEDCRIRVVKFHAISKKNMELWNKFTPTIAILPTALYQGMGFNSYGNITNVFTVQYSDHSTYEELYSFVSKVKPRKIIPIVGAKSRGPFGTDISDRANMKCFSHLLNKKCEHDTVSVIPESVQKWMYHESRSNSHGNRGGNRYKKSWKAGQKKTSSFLARGVVFSDSDDEENKISTATNLDGKNKKRKRNCAEMLESNVNNKSPLLSQEQKTTQEDHQPKETLLDKWLSVGDGNQHHKRYRPLLFKTKSIGDNFNRKFLPVNSKTSSNSQQITNDGSNGSLNLEVKKSSDVEDVIILDDTSSDSTNWSEERGVNSSTDYVDDDQDTFAMQNNPETMTSNRNSEENFQEENSFHECDQDSSINHDNSLDKVQDICSDFSGSSLPNRPIAIHAEGYVPDGQINQVSSPKHYDVKPCRQSTESKPKVQIKLSVKPTVKFLNKSSETKTHRQSLVQGGNKGSMYNVMPLCKGK